MILSAYNDGAQFQAAVAAFQETRGERPHAGGHIARIPLPGGIIRRDFLASDIEKNRGIQAPVPLCIRILEIVDGFVREPEDGPSQKIDLEQTRFRQQIWAPKSPP